MPVEAALDPPLLGLAQVHTAGLSTEADRLGTLEPTVPILDTEAGAWGGMTRFRWTPGLLSYTLGKAFTLPYPHHLQTPTLLLRTQADDQWAWMTFHVNHQMSYSACVK